MLGEIANFSAVSDLISYYSFMTFLQLLEDD